jgi:hypothetical protein
VDWMCLKMNTDASLQFVNEIDKLFMKPPLAYRLADPHNTIGVFRRGSMAENTNTLYFTPQAADALRVLIEPMGAEKCAAPRDDHEDGNVHRWERIGLSFGSAKAWDLIEK